MGQFYLHIMTAYSILQSEKVELDKATMSRICSPIFTQKRCPKADLHAGSSDPHDLPYYRLI
ncbi:hypothetical protein [Vreelandella sp. EE7]